MPAPATIDELLDLSQKSGILDKKGLDDYLHKVRSGPGVPAAPQDLAEAMVRDGLLTRFQADQLLQGKWRNFLIGGKFKLLERIGEGGMGTVFLCEHMRLKRRVALKVLPKGQAEHAGVVERFEREARAVAALDHPNIVKIHDVDKDDKLHYLVMEYVEGSSLQDIVKKKGPLDALRACHYIFQACLGLQHAHDKGLVHRDIKPGNILLDRSGAVKILDLGLARFFNDQGDNLTREHDSTSILGTADYLAPEQALDSHGVDARADIYSLGMTFYFLLVGKAPFAEGTLNQKLIWHQIRNPEPISALREDIPPELADVLNRMIEKDPNTRFQSPTEVAEALAFWVQGPIDPPPEDEMPELSRAASGGPGSNPSTPSPNSSGGLNRRATLPASPRTPPLRPAAVAIQTTPSSAGNESALGDAGAFAPSDTIKPGSGKRSIDWENVLRWGRLAGYGLVALVCLGIAWWALSRSGTTKVVSDEDEETPGGRGGGLPKKPPPRLNLRLAGEIGTFQGHGDPVERVVISRDGTRAVSCSHDQTLRLWALDTGTTEHVLSGHTGTVHDVAFSPDGRFVLSASFDMTARLWDTSTGKLVRTYAGHPSPVRAVAFSPDGGRVLTAAGGIKDNKPIDCTLRLWDRETGRPGQIFNGHTNAVWAVAFSPNGQRILSGSYDQTARVWDVAAVREVCRFTGHKASVHSVAFSPDGAIAASASADKTVCLWNAADGKEIRTLQGHTATVASVAFSPDGRYLLSGSDDRTMRLWETATGKELGVYRGHANAVWGVCFAPDGKLALSASSDKTLKLWGLPRYVAVVPVGILNRIRMPGGPMTLAVSPHVGGSREQIVSAGPDNLLRLWEVGTGEEVRRFDGHGRRPLSVAFAPDGRRLVSGGEDSSVRVWNVETGKRENVWENLGGPIRSVSFSAEGRYVLAGGDDRILRVWEPENKGAPLREFKGHEGPIYAVAVTPDGKFVVTASGDRTVRVWDLATGKEIRAFKEHTAEVRALALSPDGRLAVSAGIAPERQLRVWEVATGKALRAIAHPAGDVSMLAFAPDGRRVLACGAHPVLGLWDVADGRSLHQLAGHGGPVHGVAFSLDGRRALSSGQDGMIVEWGLPAFAVAGASPVIGQVRRFEGSHRGGVDRVAVSPDGSRAATAGLDNFATLWEVHTGQPVQRFNHGGPVHSVAFAPDGRRLVTCSEDRAVRVWDIESGSEMRRFPTAGLPWSAIFTPDGEKVFAGGADKIARLWEIKTGRELRPFAGHERDINGVAVSADGKLGLTASSDRTVRVWDLDSGQEKRCFKGHTAEVRTVVFMPDEKHALSGASDRTVLLWEVATGKVVCSFEGHTGDVFAVAAAPDGKRILSAGADRTVRLWDAGSGLLLRLFAGHTDIVPGVVFTPDGRHALSGSHDKTMRLWGLPPNVPDS